MVKGLEKATKEMTMLMALRKVVTTTATKAPDVRTNVSTTLMPK